MQDPDAASQAFKRPKPGRNERGEWARNDATAEQFAVGVVDYLRWLTERTGGIPDAAEHQLRFLRACAELVDAGTRPGGEGT